MSDSSQLRAWNRSPLERLATRPKQAQDLSGPIAADQEIRRTFRITPAAAAQSNTRGRQPAAEVRGPPSAVMQDGSLLSGTP